MSDESVLLEEQNDDEHVSSSNIDQDGSHPVSNRTDTSSTTPFAQKESKAVPRSKVVVYLLLLLLAIATAVGTWHYVKEDETNNFEHQVRVTEYLSAVNESNAAGATSDATHRYTSHDILNMGHDQVRSLYRKTSIHVHPDRGGNNEDFIRLKKSSDNLSKVRERRESVENTHRRLDQYITRSKISFASGVALMASSMLCFN